MHRVKKRVYKKNGGKKAASFDIPTICMQAIRAETLEGHGHVVVQTRGGSAFDRTGELRLQRAVRRG